MQVEDSDCPSSSRNNHKSATAVRATRTATCGAATTQHLRKTKAGDAEQKQTAADDFFCFWRTRLQLSETFGENVGA